MNRKTYFKAATAIVRAIIAGGWTDAPPPWLGARNRTRMWPTTPFTRGVQAAEMFLIMGRHFGPVSARTERLFLTRCGLIEPPFKPSA